MHKHRDVQFLKFKNTLDIRHIRAYEKLKSKKERETVRATKRKCVFFCFVFISSVEFNFCYFCFSLFFVLCFGCHLRAFFFRCLFDCHSGVCVWWPKQYKPKMLRSPSHIVGHGPTSGGILSIHTHTPTAHARSSLFDSCHRKIRLIGGGPVAFFGGLVA